MPPAGETKPASIVRAEGVVYTYASRGKETGRRIGPIDLVVDRGERVAIVGPNGSGKSTLVNLFSGASSPHSGTLSWFGRRGGTEARRRIGVVFQQPSLDELLTVSESLGLAGRLLHMASADIAARTSELLGRLGLEDRAGSRIGALSGGLARRVDLARAIMHQPELLLLDEPTAGLDDESARVFNSIVDDVVQQGVAVVSATHTPEEVRLASRVVVMAEGRVVADRSPPPALHGSLQEFFAALSVAPTVVAAGGGEGDL
jgi:ABC-2 type transport system ATP-binding protein